MKSLFLFLSFVSVVLVMAVSPKAASPIATQADFTEAVRKELNLGSTNLLPDTTLNEISERAVVWVSADVGGVEAQFRILTVAGTAFYGVPDSIVAILHATMRSDEDGTRTIKAWYPQYLDELGVDPSLPVAMTGTSNDDEVPSAYQWWADTLQLMPAPVDAGDTIIIKCYVEHPILDTLKDTPDATDDVVFTYPAYTEAAIDYACYKTLRMLGRLEEATLYFAAYEKQRQVLIQKYTRGFDVVRGTQ